MSCSVRFANGALVPPVGMGTWRMGERPDRRVDEISALRTGIEHGCALIDTAESYGDGEAEELVGEALRGIDRDRVTLVSKVSPCNAGRDRIFASCRASLARLRTDYLDLYLLHWRGEVPLAETVACMNELVAQGAIRAWGVSNFDVGDMRELERVPGGERCAANQVLYHLGSRGIEYELLPWMASRGMPAMAYCPLARGGRLSEGLLGEPEVAEVAARHGATPAQVLLAFAIRSGRVVAIPRAGSPAHAVENARAADLALTEDDLELLARFHAPPSWKMPLDME